ncbi:acyl-protein thioesterase 1 [Onthophagus taurus]|uniref:acyl-protein thioesterase 1 n=1 Tax=Onthophagus taurus TaxID=166361 RepID=UPI000C20579B|nr:acyl-protein thioesterase 1-like [Onthophagus taurus]XP_022920788.1 acyl-protein thioesterase 1-like [Onthophagus taurus]
MAAPVVIAASAKHTATIIFLHGLGDTGAGWASAMAAIRAPHVKVVCPTAPTMPVTLNAGYRMPSWFDLKSLDIGGPEDEDGIKAACKLVHGMIETEIKAGLSADRIILGGFSQGGALALYSALRFPQKVAGVVALSCWLPLHKSFPMDMVCPTDLPVLLCHGDCDPVVPYKLGQMTSSVLKNFLKDTDFKSYRGLMHTSSDEELRDVKDFIDTKLPLI